MRQIIIEAINNRKVLEFYYNNKRRVVEPYTFGTNTKNNLMLSVYQTEGESSRELPDWNYFTVDKILELKVLDISFDGNRDGYVQGDSRMNVIYAEVR
jgi:predicted DNA-binding transcriptional regulator YafY